MFDWIFSNKQIYKDLGLFVIRFGIGSILVLLHGYGKITGGTEKWIWLGSHMKNFGITFWPAMWGFAAACSEFFGGLCLILGLGTRIAAFFVVIVMIVALMYHIKKGDAIDDYEYPLFLLIVIIGILIAGGGKFSLDYHLKF